MMRLFLAVALAAISLPALGHDWYPIECCSGQDCREVTDDAIQVTPAGYRILATNEVIPFRQAKPSPDRHYHRCSQQGLDDTPTICLFVPDFGS